MAEHGLGAILRTLTGRQLQALVRRIAAGWIFHGAQVIDRGYVGIKFRIAPHRTKLGKPLPLALATAGVHAGSAARMAGNIKYVLVMITLRIGPALDHLQALQRCTGETQGARIG